MVKQNHQGEEVWRYPARILEVHQDRVIVEAFFNHTDMLIQGVQLKQGDRFIETYFFKQWYNLLELHDRDDDRLKGWYCNICRPTVFSDSTIRFDDMALDLLIYPDRSKSLLDRDEFDALGLDEKTRQACWRAVEILENLAKVITPYSLSTGANDAPGSF